MTKKEHFTEFRRNGVIITQELVRCGEYTGKPTEKLDRSTDRLSQIAKVVPDGEI